MTPVLKEASRAEAARPATRSFPRAVPKPTPETATFWQKAAMDELWIQRCETCSKPYFYPRNFCPRCGSDDVAWIPCSGDATLHSYVIEQRPAPGFQDDVPYAVAIVELAEGPRMMSMIVEVVPEPENLVLDMPLRVTFQQRGDLKIPMFSPRED